MDVLLRIAQQWLQPNQIVQWVTLDQFLQVLPGEERRAVEMKVAKNPRDMVTALECTFSTLNMGRRETRGPY